MATLYEAKQQVTVEIFKFLKNVNKLFTKAAKSQLQGSTPEKGSSIASFKIVNIIYSLHLWQESLG